MSSAEATPSKKRRQYATRACNGCRRRRCKCDGVQPTCGTCAASGHECSWSSESDARRPATKQLVESLRVKIQVLEAEVARLKDRESTGATISSPGTSLFVEGSSRIQLQPPTSIGSIAEAGPIPEDSIVSAGSINSASPQSPSLDRSHVSSAERSLSVPTPQFTATVMYKYIFQIDTSVPMNDQSTETRLSLVCDWDRHLPLLEDFQLSRLEHDIILSRCFKYGTSWLLGLIPEIFLHDMLYSLTSGPAQSDSSPQTRLQHYTPMLHCSILAFASAFSDNPIIRSRATRDKYALQAKLWLDEELKHPVMSLVRALALLAEYHCGVGEKDSGYMYMGMSIRAARAMISSTERDRWIGQGIVAYPESVTRDWHFWSTFAQDKIMSLDYGRMFDMPIPYLGVSLPSVDPELDSRPWPIDIADASIGHKAQPKITTQTFLESCKLMVIGARIIDAAHLQGQNPQEDGTTINLHLQLDTWFNNLPEGLLVWARSTSPLPHVIVLHICYWWLLIYLHQPLYHRAPPLDPNSHLPSADLSVKMCDRAAHKIVQLLNMFDDQHSLRFFPRNMLQAICASGSALLMECASSPAGAAKKRAMAHDGVGVCLRALRALVGTWPCAERLANELEARLEEQRSHSRGVSSEALSMEVDELENDMDDWQPGVLRTSYPPTHEQPLQSHGLAIHQMPPISPNEQRSATVKIKEYKPFVFNEESINKERQGALANAAGHWDHALMQAFPVCWTV